MTNEIDDTSLYVLTNGQGFAAHAGNDLDNENILTRDEALALLRESPGLNVYRLVPADTELNPDQEDGGHSEP